MVLHILGERLNVLSTSWAGKASLFGFDAKYIHFKNTDHKMLEGNWKKEGWGIPV